MVTPPPRRAKSWAIPAPTFRPTRPRVTRKLCRSRPKHRCRKTARAQNITRGSRPTRLPLFDFRGHLAQEFADAKTDRGRLQPATQTRQESGGADVALYLRAVVSIGCG